MARQAQGLELYSEEYLLKSILEEHANLELAVAKLRKAQMTCYVAALVLLLIAGYFYISESIALSYILVLGAGLAVGFSMLPAQAAVQSPITYKYFDLDRIRERISELESGE